jgi:hypothetical protein
MGNMDILGNRLQREISDTLQKRLPPGWKVTAKPIPSGMEPVPDFLFELAGPKGARTRLAVEIKAHLAPKDALALRDLCDQYAQAYGDGVVPVVSTAFVSPSTRQRFKELAISYADPTGNVRIVASQPAVYLETQGAERNPNRENRQLRSLKGPKAGRIVRALCDLPGPYGVRKLADETGINPGYVSRVFAFLEREDLLARGPLGDFRAVRLRKLIERWSRNYSFLGSNRVVSFLDPRDPAGLPARLVSAVKRVAITGSAAAAAVAPVAPSRLIMAYVDSPENAAEKLGLRSADSGTNVLLAQPYDAVVFKRTIEREGVPYVALSQAAVDLLGSPGRGPAEAQALLDWMGANEPAWRR